MTTKTITYEETLAILSGAVEKDLSEIPSTSLQHAHLIGLTDEGGPYAPEDDPTVGDLLGYARQCAAKCRDAVSLREALAAIDQS